jgi:dCTP deaminase
LILTSQEIMIRLGKDIIIEPYDNRNLNPNSYNLHLNDKLLIYDCDILDCKKPNPVRELIIDPDGLLLMPGQLYLGSTVEYTESHGVVPLIEGRSSIARLGMSIHASAGFGDLGFSGHWTLEITVTKPVIVYPGMAVAQIFYHTVKGAVERTYHSGKYQSNEGVQPSMLWKDFQ